MHSGEERNQLPQPSHSELGPLVEARLPVGAQRLVIDALEQLKRRVDAFGERVAMELQPSWTPRSRATTQAPCRSATTASHVCGSALAVPTAPAHTRMRGVSSPSAAPNSDVISAAGETPVRQ